MFFVNSSEEKPKFNYKARSGFYESGESIWIYGVLLALCMRILALRNHRAEELTTIG
jgi:hypothetical protein